MTKRRVLIIDDEAGSRQGLSALINNWGFVTETAIDGEQGLERIDAFQPQVVIADLVMPNLDGLGLLASLSQRKYGPAVVMLTAKGSIASAVEAMKRGAFDYLTKPVETLQLQQVLEKAFERTASFEEIKRYNHKLESSGCFGRLVGSSSAMTELYDLMRQAGPSAASVLIVGESGTGKELVARTLHDLSPRREGPFVALNCAAIPETLLESEIFGHERGAFTGADVRRQGCFELASGGSLLLDEVSEMAPATQAKLLRVLEERTFRRLGGAEEVAVDVRVLAATNRDTKKALSEGQLREDLFYRLNVFTLELPALRNRLADIELLVASFIEEFNKPNQKSITCIEPEALNLLRSYWWPGNVRELRNLVERAVIVARTDCIIQDDLPPHLADPFVETDRVAVEIPVGTTVGAAERSLIMRTLNATEQNKTRAAEILGISLKTLHNKLKKYQEID